MVQAEAGIEELRKNVDSLVVIPNERLKYVTDQKITLVNAFEIADEVLRQGVQSICDLIRNTGVINLDFADVTAIMKDAGYAHMGVGRAAGKNAEEEAVKMAIASPLLETSIKGAHGLLVNFTGAAETMDLMEIDQAASLVQQEVDPAAKSIVGVTIDDSMGDEVRVIIIATGFSEEGEGGEPAPKQEEKAEPAAQEASSAEQADPPAPVEEKDNAAVPAGLAPLDYESEKSKSRDDDIFDILKIFNREK